METDKDERGRKMGMGSPEEEEMAQIEPGV